MTPLATQLFRYGDAMWKSVMPDCQFFECSSVTPLAHEMAEAEGASGAPYSELAVLPAEGTFLETWTAMTGRLMYFCTQEGSSIRFGCWQADNRGGKAPRLRFASGFTPGTHDTLPVGWQPDDLVNDELDPIQRSMAMGSNALVEKLLCILNQPGLVERIPRPTDKRVLREMGKPKDRTTWHECRIRGDRHAGTGSDCIDGDPQRPLHYVRKFFRPSSRQWIEGYWRGDESLGVHLKWYSAPGARKLNATSVPLLPLGELVAAP